LGDPMTPPRRRHGLMVRLRTREPLLPSSLSLSLSLSLSRRLGPRSSALSFSSLSSGRRYVRTLDGPYNGRARRRTNVYRLERDTGLVSSRSERLPMHLQVRMAEKPTRVSEKGNRESCYRDCCYRRIARFLVVGKRNARVSCTGFKSFV